MHEAHWAGLQMQSYQETTWDDFAPGDKTEQNIRPLGQQANPKKASKEYVEIPPKEHPYGTREPPSFSGIRK